MSYSNHETTEFAIYIENTEPLWRDMQTTLAEAYEEDPCEENMHRAMKFALQATADQWFYSARTALRTHVRDRYASEVACLYLATGFDAIEIEEIAKTWVENYLTERNMG